MPYLDILHQHKLAPRHLRRRPTANTSQPQQPLRYVRGCRQCHPASAVVVVINAAVALEKRFKTDQGAGGEGVILFEKIEISALLLELESLVFSPLFL